MIIDILQQLIGNQNFKIKLMEACSIKKSGDTIMEVDQVVNGNSMQQWKGQPHVTMVGEMESYRQNEDNNRSPLQSSTSTTTAMHCIQQGIRDLNLQGTGSNPMNQDRSVEFVGQVIQHKTSDAHGVERVLSYRNERVVGNGSFGVVFQATCLENGEQVAIKKVLQDRRFKNRELQMMKVLNHPNVVQLRQYFYCKDNEENTYLHLVLELVPDTVYRIFRYYNRSSQRFPLILVKLYIYQLARALNYIHRIGVCHRDIKPQNLLVNPTTHVLKLCDFGSAKILVQGEPNISYICSRYYRAPELIFGASEYSTAIDIWSVGCVLGELLLGAPLFPGDSGVDQLVEIVKKLGTPSKEEVAAMNPQQQDHRFPQIKPNPWYKIFKRAPQEGLDLIQGLLQYDPSKRLQSSQIMAHPFFDELRDKRTRLPDGRPLPPLTNWQPGELDGLSQELVSKLVQQQYKQSSTS
eukprot:TRINITY_DN1181_c0_g1_i12.p1 TRINITY_DN1181_c0_g1~~TRINITY_DN1181_c0_g1_i12.p1  ORF type:complete len:464 (+),score=28.89 TRINITY_DN1181_c0_g1_i12:167-1558(+)